MYTLFAVGNEPKPVLRYPSIRTRLSTYLNAKYGHFKISFFLKDKRILENNGSFLAANRDRCLELEMSEFLYSAFIYILRILGQTVLYTLGLTVLSQRKAPIKIVKIWWRSTYCISTDIWLVLLPLPIFIGNIGQRTSVLLCLLINRDFQLLFQFLISTNYVPTPNDTSHTSYSLYYYTILTSTSPYS